MTVTADKTNLACLLDLQEHERIEDIIPEPYRMQSGFGVYIPYSVFRDYMSSRSLNVNIFTSIKLNRLKQCIFSNSSDVILYYYSALAAAQAKELAIAEHYHSEATLLLSSFSDGTDVHYLDVDNYMGQLVSVPNYISTGFSGFRDSKFVEATTSIGFQRLLDKMSKHNVKISSKVNVPSNAAVVKLAGFYESLALSKDIPNKYTVTM